MRENSFVNLSAGEDPLVLPQDAVVYALWDGRTTVFTKYPELVQRAEKRLPAPELVT